MNKSRLSRRAFSAMVTGAGAATISNAKQNATKQITQASVPGDPAAPAPQTGTLPEIAPFQSEVVFTRSVVPPRVKPFRMTEVRLLPGAFKDAQEANRAVLKNLPADRLLHSFRVNAGLLLSAHRSAVGKNWIASCAGHFTGHFLSGLRTDVFVHRRQGPESQGDYMVAELAKCQQKLGGGYLSAFPIELFDRLKARKEVWAPFYTVHKIMAGMLDMHQDCDNQQALDVLKGMAGWADAWTASMPEEHMQLVFDTEYGGMNEVLYNLAAVTGDRPVRSRRRPLYKETIFQSARTAARRVAWLARQHAYPASYRSCAPVRDQRDQRFHDVADYFWHEVTGTRTYVTGGTSNNEGWLVEPNTFSRQS